MDVETVSSTIEKAYQMSHAPQNVVEEPVRGTPVAVTTDAEAVGGVVRSGTDSIPSTAIDRPGFSLQEAVDILLENDEIPTPSNIFVEPPQPSILTDEESGDEDE
ncbi:hypothetical protein GE061_003727 [Apolygus lucorum]|uniref:Uncharacterized protein n=1 Tax=Apolygus lucorum TaxID=248454 RepID=A0A8S9X4A4_APOLU|nr:hypothetical protein GE061_003727 [Apolygus lucorum]